MREFAKLGGSGRSDELRLSKNNSLRLIVDTDKPHFLGIQIGELEIAGWAQSEILARIFRHLHEIGVFFWLWNKRDIVFPILETCLLVRIWFFLTPSGILGFAPLSKILLLFHSFRKPGKQGRRNTRKTLYNDITSAAETVRRGWLHWVYVPGEAQGLTARYANARNCTIVSSM